MSDKEIYENYIKEIYKYLYFITKNKEQAEDITSECFTRFFESKNKDLININKIKPFLIGIARNIVFDKYKDKSSKNLNLINIGGEIIEVEDKVNFENMVIDESLVNTIRRNLNLFDDLTKEIVILKVWEELKFEEIARILNQNSNTIKTIYYKAVEDLRIKLQSSKVELKSISVPLILGSIYLLSKSQEYNITNTVLNTFINSTLFIKNFSMNNMPNVTDTAVSAKLEILSTMSSKTALMVVGIVFGSAAVGLFVVATNNNQNKGTTSVSSKSSTKSNINISPSSSSTNSPNTISSSSNQDLMSSTSSSIIQPTGVVSEGGQYYISSSNNLKFYYLNHFGSVSSTKINNSPCSASPIERITFSKSPVEIDFNGCSQGGGNLKEIQHESWLSSDNKSFNFSVIQINDSNEYVVSAYYSTGSTKGLLVQVPTDGGTLNKYLTLDQVSIAKEDVKEIVNSLSFSL